MTCACFFLFAAAFAVDLPAAFAESRPAVMPRALSAEHAASVSGGAARKTTTSGLTEHFRGQSNVWFVAQQYFQSAEANVLSILRSIAPSVDYKSGTLRFPDVTRWKLLLGIVFLAGFFTRKIVNSSRCQTVALAAAAAAAMAGSRFWRWVVVPKGAAEMEMVCASSLKDESAVGTPKSAWPAATRLAVATISGECTSGDPESLEGGGGETLNNDDLNEEILEAPTPNTERHVRGRRCWVPLWVVTFGILYAAVLVMTGLRWSEQGFCVQSWWCVTKMYICTFIAALMWLYYLWLTTTRNDPVPLGLLVSVWFFAGTVSVLCCSLCNWAMVQLWAWMNPYCYITFPADNWPWDYTSGTCIFINVVQWILTAGVIEESFKFFGLLRLRPTLAKVREGQAWFRFKIPGLPPYWFARLWNRLGESPLAVALCGIAAGGGLATSENFMYIFNQESIQKAFQENDLEAAYGRIAASFAHMVWTGYAACGLARWQFLPPGHPGRPKRRSSYLITPIILHGLYNWCSTLQRCEAYEEMYQGELYKSDGCYLPPMWRKVFKGLHMIVVLLSFYWWHSEFSEIAPEDDE